MFEGLRCTRCGCTTTEPCPGGCAWVLPDLCSRCLQPDELRLVRHFTSAEHELRTRASDDRADRLLGSVVQGLLANPQLQPWGPEPFPIATFVVCALSLASALADASAPEGDDDDPAVQLLLP